jgi:hypothetical protein
MMAVKFRRIDDSSERRPPPSGHRGCGRLDIVAAS